MNNEKNPNNETMTVLVVEDEVLLSMEISMKLKQLGYNVCPMVSDGNETLSMVPHYSPDVAILDISISGDMDGVTLANTLYQEYDIPIIFMSGYAKNDMMKLIGDIPFLDYLNKPILFEELSKSLEKLKNK